MIDPGTFLSGLDSEFTADIGTRVTTHRNRFARIFRNRYLEMLPTTITYYNGNSISVDWLKVEVCLRNGYDVVIGQNRVGLITFLGYCVNRMSPSNPTAFLGAVYPLTYDDIIWNIPNSMKPERANFHEITVQDDCASGSFVVLRNKTLNYVNDLEIINHYTAELAEIVVSRYSATMQAKIMTFFMAQNVNDESINKIVTDLFNGVPYAKGTQFLDPDDIMKQYQTDNIPSLLTELKREYQNKISELNNMLGMNSLAVEKSSGVSDTEANSNRAFTVSNGNIYLDGRGQPLNCLNKRFNLQIYPLYNDDAISKMTILEQMNESAKAVKNDENNNNGNGRNSIGTDTSREE